MKNHFLFIAILVLFFACDDKKNQRNIALNDTFKSGIFVAMSDNKTFHFYKWEDIAGEDLKIAPKKHQKRTSNK